MSSTGATDHDFRVFATVREKGTITFCLEEQVRDDFTVRFIVDPLSNEVTALISLKKEPKP